MNYTYYMNRQEIVKVLSAINVEAKMPRAGRTLTIALAGGVIRITRARRNLYKYEIVRA